MASTYLTRTFSSAGNRQSWTWSGWVKKSTSYNNSSSGDREVWFGGYSANNNTDWLEFGTQGDILYATSSGISTTSTQVLRDVNGWYHVLVNYNGSNLKFYVNNELFKDSTDFSGNRGINVAGTHTIGAIATDQSIRRFTGLMTHVHFIDGTIYTPSAFGETDSTTGIWVPKVSPSVTYGTNGFFLKFANSGSMGTDSSGNGNNFTVSGNLTQTQDTPSNVFCYLNPLTKRAGGTLTNLNTTYEAATSDSSVFGTLAVPAGMKVYFEVKLDSNTAQNFLGIHNKYDGGDGAFVKGGSEAGSYGLKVRGASSVVQYFNNGSSTNTAINNYSNGTIIGVAIDNANGHIHYHANGTYINSSDPSDNSPAALVTGFDTTVEQYLHFSLDTTITQPKNLFNFGNGYFGTTAVSSANSDDAGYGLFEYAPPTGYYSLCTNNINTYG